MSKFCCKIRHSVYEFCKCKRAGEEANTAYNCRSSKPKQDEYNGQLRDERKRKDEPNGKHNTSRMSQRASKDVHNISSVRHAASKTQV